jgi:membrane associated rhomboid family serine protease
MLLTPTDRPFDWKNPPRFALGLALVLLLIFIPWHLADLRLQSDLAEQYRAKLLVTEWPLYETHALKTGQRSTLNRLKADYAEGRENPQKLDGVALYVAMDDGFVASMKKQGRDYLAPDQFTRWETARDEFDPQRGRLSGRALGIDPQKDTPLRPITFLTFGLVQADVIQFLSAILLIITLGIAIELAIGSGAVLAAFLGGGVTGAIAFLLSNGGNVLPLSGASVGMASVAGLYLMHFRGTRLRLFSRFDVPAYSFALLWLLLVAAEFILSPLRVSEVVARVAALASGPFWAFAYSKWFAHAADYMPVITSDAPEDDSQKAYREKLAKALDAVAQLEFPTAQKLLREMVKEYPSDLRVLTQLYYVEKLTPGTPAFEAVARRLFNFSTADSDALVLRLYRDYLRYSPEKAALDVDTGIKLVMRFTRMGEVMEADKLMRMVLDKKTEHALIGKTAAALADALERLREPTRARFFRQVASG